MSDPGAYRLLHLPVLLYSAMESSMTVAPTDPTYADLPGVASQASEAELPAAHMTLILYSPTVLLTASCNGKLMSSVPTLIDVTAGLTTFKAT